MHKGHFRVPKSWHSFFGVTTRLMIKRVEVWPVRVKRGRGVGSALWRQGAQGGGGEGEEETSSRSRCSSTPDQRVGGLFTLRACPPTRLHAPYVYAPSYARSVHCQRLVSVPPWVGPHPQNPTPRDPPTHPPRDPPPPHPPPPPPTPTHPPPPPPPHPPPPPPPLVWVEGCSEWMAIPSGWLFRWLFWGVLLFDGVEGCNAFKPHS